MKSRGAEGPASENREYGLNESQRLFALTRFSKIDELLQAIARMAEPNPSPFSRYVADLAPGAAEKLAPIAEEVREKMVSALRDLGADLPAPEQSSRWMIQTSLTFIDVALSGMTEKALHGYGEVDPRARARLESAVREIKALIDKARTVTQE